MWAKLRPELVRRYERRQPVFTLKRHIANHIAEVGDDYVVVKSELTGTPRKIRASVIDDLDIDSVRLRGGQISSIVLALRDLQEALERSGS